MGRSSAPISNSMKVEIKNRSKVRGYSGHDALKEYSMLPRINTNQTPDPSRNESFDRAMAHLNKQRQINYSY